jgi:MraZ protein
MAVPVRHLVLFGEYEISIDDKNRLVVPSDIRQSIDPQRDGDAFFLVVGQNDRPWLYPELYYEQLVSRDPGDVTPDESALAFDQMHFALASRLEPDKQGRMLIPEKILRRTGIERDLTMIGVRDHLELWPRSEWDAHREGLLRRSGEIALRARLARQSQPRRENET